MFELQGLQILLTQPMLINRTLSFLTIHLLALKIKLKIIESNQTVTMVQFSHTALYFFLESPVIHSKYPRTVGHVSLVHLLLNLGQGKK